MDITIEWSGAKTITSDLIIASGTTITSDGGVISIAATGTTADAATPKIVNNGGSVNIKVDSYTGSDRSFYQLALNGEFSIERGSVWVNGAKLTGDNNVITTRGGELRITGDLNGTLKIELGQLAGTQPVIYFDDFTVNAGATLQLATGNDEVTPTYYTVGDFNLYGNLILLALE